MDGYEYVRAIVTTGLKNDPVNTRIRTLGQDGELKTVIIIVQFQGRH